MPLGKPSHFGQVHALTMLVFISIRCPERRITHEPYFILPNLLPQDRKIEFWYYTLNLLLCRMLLYFLFLVSDSTVSGDFEVSWLPGIHLNLPGTTEKSNSTLGNSNHHSDCHPDGCQGCTWIMLV